MRALKSIVSSRAFDRLWLVLIVLSSILLGLLSYPTIVVSQGRWLGPLETVILWLFVAEVVMRIGAHWPRPWEYLFSGWNLFDLFVVLASVLPIHSEAASVFRLIRVLRALRLLKAVPGLQVVVRGMFKSVASLGYISLILCIHFYIFGLAGIKLFGPLDPEHFASLADAFLTLFQVVTLEGWVDVMHGLIAAGASQVVAVTYFVSFILIGTMVIMNLVIGVIINGMMESQKELLADASRTKSSDDMVIQEINQLDLLVTSLRDEVARLRSLLSERRQ
ncbi:MAG: ion transporter [candidate division Zixibacteria bacterium]|nr:ion transporter [candidate division Zixibacteria bacterium]